VAGQLVRCGTAGAPNYAEARGAENKKDFVHKLGICLKEVRDSQCWLQLIVRADLLPGSRLTQLLDESDRLIARSSSSRSPPPRAAKRRLEYAILDP
jgi:four helix bundle protein